MYIKLSPRTPVGDYLVIFIALLILHPCLKYSTFKDFRCAVNLRFHKNNDTTRNIMTMTIHLSVVVCTLQSVIVKIGVVQYLLLMETICENTHTLEIVFVYGLIDSKESF